MSLRVGRLCQMLSILTLYHFYPSVLVQKQKILEIHFQGPLTSKVSSLDNAMGTGLCKIWKNVTKGKATISHPEVAGKGWARTGRALTTSEHPAGISQLAPIASWPEVISGILLILAFPASLMSATLQRWKPLFPCIKFLPGRNIYNDFYFPE